MHFKTNRQTAVCDGFNGFYIKLHELKVVLPKWEYSQENILLRFSDRVHQVNLYKSKKKNDNALKIKHFEKIFRIQMTQKAFTVVVFIIIAKLLE